MLLHYLKVAVRQMGKYRSHQLISALCLAVGIICFAYAWLFVYMVEQAYERPGHDRRVQVYLTKDKTRGHQEPRTRRADTKSAIRPTTCCACRTNCGRWA